MQAIALFESWISREQSADAALGRVHKEPFSSSFTLLLLLFFSTSTLAHHNTTSKAAFLYTYNRFFFL
ncbi:Nuclear transport factor 2 [Fusarium oxysporum f. sp. albedinis]|nr:Nuclear transport factor 2 [Fusarium oxysporum f. sp. albedinis]